MNSSQILFPGFLADPSQYVAVEKTWRSHWDEMICHAGNGEQWDTPWLGTNYADGSPFRDGNPIFSAVCRERRLGVRVIQLEPEGNVGEASLWIDQFALGESEEVEELVISCVLTKANVYDCINIMAQWVANGTVRLSQKSKYSNRLRPVRPSQSGKFAFIELIYRSEQRSNSLSH